MYTGEEIVAELTHMGITHVVWLPDTVLGPWESALEQSSDVQLVRVCREGEAWPLAAGLMLGGQSPLVMIQTTGLFESGDALRNVAHDLELPVFALIGARNWLNATSRDSAKLFAKPILQAWNIEYVLIESPEQKPLLAKHYRDCQAARRPGIAVLAE